MSKVSKKFFEQIEEMARTQQYDVEVVEKILNIVVVSKMLADQESNEEVKRTLNSIGIVGESLAKKALCTKGQIASTKYKKALY